MILQTFVDINYLLHYIGLKVLQLLQHLDIFSEFFFFFFFVLAKNFIISGVCNSSLYPSFILNFIDVNMKERNCCLCFNNCKTNSSLS